MDFPTIDYKTFNSKEASALLKEFGVLVIENVISEDDCKRFAETTVKELEELGSGIDRNNIKGTWKDDNLPPQVRPGMMSFRPSPVKEIWKRRDIKDLFRSLYNGIGKQIKEDELLIHSIDRVNIKPGEIGPYTEDLNPIDDWPHLDQTDNDNPYKCIQSSFVITNSSACFRCSPKSHKVFTEILDMCGYRGDKGNWCPIKKCGKIGMSKRLVEKAGGKWQIVIPAKRGSCVLWLSSVVHSATYQLKKTEKNPDFFGWRIVYYITFHPASEFTESQKKKIKKYEEDNRFMNHWNTMVFQKWPNARYKDKREYHDAIIKYVDG